MLLRRFQSVKSWALNACSKTLPLHVAARQKCRRQYGPTRKVWHPPAPSSTACAPPPSQSALVALRWRWAPRAWAQRAPAGPQRGGPPVPAPRQRSQGQLGMRPVLRPPARGHPMASLHVQDHNVCGRICCMQASVVQLRLRIECRSPCWLCRLHGLLAVRGCWR